MPVYPNQNITRISSQRKTFPKDMNVTGKKLSSAMVEIVSFVQGWFFFWFFLKFQLVEKKKVEK